VLQCDELLSELITSGISVKLNQDKTGIYEPKYVYVMSMKFNSSHNNQLILRALHTDVTSDEFFTKIISLYHCMPPKHP